MIGRLVLFGILVALLFWLPTVSSHGFETRPLVVTGLLGVAAAATFWRRSPTDEG